VLFLGVDATWVRPRGEATEAVAAPPSSNQPASTQPAQRPSAATAPAPSAAGPFGSVTHHLSQDAAWRDGLTEFATYEVTRIIDGKPRTSIARVTTRMGFADPVTKTISAAADPVAAGHREVFIQHTREEVPGGDDSAARSQSLTAFVGTQDMKSLKIDFVSHDDRGATFKQFVNHKGTLTWSQYSSRPGEGPKSGNYTPPANLVFFNALPLMLRGFPFHNANPTYKVQLLPDQTADKLTAADPQPAVLIGTSGQVLDLPIGKVEALSVILMPEGKDSDTQSQRQEYWFAAEGKPPMLHVMVQYTGADGTVYKLKSLKRKAGGQ